MSVPTPKNHLDHKNWSNSPNSKITKKIPIFSYDLLVEVDASNDDIFRHIHPIGDSIMESLFVGPSEIQKPPLLDHSKLHPFTRHETDD